MPTKRIYTEAVEPMFPSIAAFFATAISWFTAHVSTLTAVVFFVIVLFNLKLVYYRAKNEKEKNDRYNKKLDK